MRLRLKALSIHFLRGMVREALRFSDKGSAFVSAGSRAVLLALLLTPLQKRLSPL